MDVANPLVRAAVLIFMFSKSTRAQWSKFIANDIHVPINIILWRMNIEHDMSSAILMKAGIETGMNLYGHSNFAISYDGVSKMILGNFTFYSKAIVTTPDNIQLLLNVKPDGYRGGNNTLFLRNRKDMPTPHPDRDRRSIIATAIPITDNRLPWSMNFAQRASPDEIHSGGMHKTGSHSYATAEYYDGGIWRIGETVKMTSSGLDNFFDYPDRVNTIAMQGHQFLYNHTSSMFDRVVECTGHRGRYGSYPGAAEVWNGRDAYFQPQIWGNFKLE